MGFRIKYCMSEGPYLKKKAWFFVYRTRWGFCTDLLGVQRLKQRLKPSSNVQLSSNPTILTTIGTEMLTTKYDFP